MRSGAGFGWQRTWKDCAGTGEPGKSSCRSRPNHDRPLPCPPACASFGLGFWRWNSLTEASCWDGYMSWCASLERIWRRLQSLLGRTEPGP